MPTDRAEYQKQYRKAYATKTRSIRVALTRQEYSRVEREAKQNNTTVAAFSRGQILKEPIQAVSSNINASEDAAKEVVFLLRNIANNINQMAYHSNRLRMVLDENEPLIVLQELETELKAFLKKRQP